MRLLNLILRHFKGITYFILDANGNDVTVFGDNATGKTSLADAVNWLFFDKDSLNKKDFGIKTLDADGNEIHNLEHEVTGTFEINGGTNTLKKVFSEKWTKQRGSTSATFTGHETSYWIDGVPKSKKEYDKFIAGIADESIFKLLTNPLFFNEQLHWQKRREILIQVCGNISDADVIASDKALSELPKILGNRSLEDHRKVILSRRSKINEELERIPDRIDENTRLLPDLTGIPHREVIQTEINSLKSQQQDKQQEIARIENGGETAEKQRQLSELESRILDIQNRHRAATSDKVFAKKQQLQNSKLAFNDIDATLQSIQRNITTNAAEIKRCEVSIQTLRDKWYEVNDQKFTYEQDCICPTCRQQLPEEQLQAARQTALERFNLDKSKRLEAINTDGQNFKDKIAALSADTVSLQERFDRLITEKETAKQYIESMQTEIDNMDNGPDITDNAEYVKALQDKAAIQAQIQDLNAQKHGVIQQLKSDIGLIAQDISARENKIMTIDQHEKGKKRIIELEAEQKTLAVEYEKLESELNLTEQFIRTKVNMLESRINSKFKYARFKLFDQQINGGLVECCETLYGGVPFSSGLNKGHSVIVGMDIIKTLSDHYGFSGPIFVDNAESVTKLPDIDAQIVRLIKPEITDENRQKFSKLVVEVEGRNKLREAV